MLIFDAHLDLAINALDGQDLTMPAMQQPPTEDGPATVSFRDLAAGGVQLICATLFCRPDSPQNPPHKTGYRTADEAHSMARRQIEWYRQQEQAGRLRIITAAAELPAPRGKGFQPVHSTPAQVQSAPLQAIILMEGADPIRTPAEAAEWFASGVRIVGLAWKQTRYAGGTGAPRPLTPEGVQLVKELDKTGMIHDLSHLAEQSFWQLLDQSGGPVIATHSNCRALVPGDRHLSDEMIRAVITRGGVIGMNLYDKFLLPAEQLASRRATLADVVRHVDHICDLAGNARHVGIGTDLDGGFGRDQIPREIATAADLPRLAVALASAGYGDEDIRAILCGNFLSFFRRHLPATPA